MCPKFRGGKSEKIFEKAIKTGTRLIIFKNNKKYMYFLSNLLFANLHVLKLFLRFKTCAISVSDAHAVTTSNILCKPSSAIVLIFVEAHFNT